MPLLFDGGTPLFSAISKGHRDVVELLLRAGASLVTDIWIDGLSSASLGGHRDVVELLLRAGADKDGVYGCRVTPVLAACLQGHKDVVELLLQAGADTDKITELGITPLYAACRGGFKKCVELLLRAGAGTDKADFDGCTPLHTASRNGHKAVVELLLLSGADNSKMEFDGLTPLFIASQNGHKDIVTLLREAGADEAKTLLLHHLPDKQLLTPEALEALIANNFQSISKPHPPLQQLQHSAIHLAISFLNKGHTTALPVAQQILSTFPSDHPTLPQLRSRVHPQQQPIPGPTHLPVELRAKLVAELIDEDWAPKSKKKNGKKRS